MVRAQSAISALDDSVKQTYDLVLITNDGKVGIKNGFVIGNERPAQIDSVAPDALGKTTAETVYIMGDYLTANLTASIACRGVAAGASEVCERERERVSE